MPAISVTFIGGDETEVGNIAFDEWGNDATGRIRFPLNKAIVLDPSKVSVGDRPFVEHVMKKAASNRFYAVADPKDAKGDPAVLIKPQPLGKGSVSPRKKAAA